MNNNQKKMTTTTPDITSLSLANTSPLENLPLALLEMIFASLDTVQSLAHLSLASKKLLRAVQTTGYRAFAKGHFCSLSLQRGIRDEQWQAVARMLTWQSRAWDRRAFSVASVVPPPAKSLQGHGERRRGRQQQHRQARMQSFPPQIVVDASARLNGQVEDETVAWGVGENVVVRWRNLKRSDLKKEKWKAIDGGPLGFKAGEDDVTAISILADSPAGSGLLVGRASGQLHLLSTDKEDFGEMKASFEPYAPMMQSDVQHFDVNGSHDTVAVITKENVLFYPLAGAMSEKSEVGQVSTIPAVVPAEVLNLRQMESSQGFRSLRAAKFLPNGDLAICANGSREPLRYIQRRPTGTVISNAAKMLPSERCAKSFLYSPDRLQNARDLLPVNTSSIAGGSGNTILSSYDDGTVRLQDLRTPSAVDTIYQDLFEIFTPIGPLLSYGTERFIGGCARSEIVKIFDFRWPKRSYSYTDALPCSRNPLGPIPKPLTFNPAPQVPDCDSCAYLSGHTCARHALARTDFYKPNCNLYLPTVYRKDSPVYSLAKSSDMSATIYAGLTSELVEVNLQDSQEMPRRGFSTLKMGRHKRCGYDYVEHMTSMVETGDGFALEDVSKSQRLPNIHKQTGERAGVSRKMPQRLDDLFL
jgi:hypothetical protein